MRPNSSRLVTTSSDWQTQKSKPHWRDPHSTQSRTPKLHWTHHLKLQKSKETIYYEWQSENTTGSEPLRTWNNRTILGLRADHPRMCHNGMLIILNQSDFPGGPAAKTLHYQCREGLGLIPRQGTRSHMLQLTVGMLQWRSKIPCDTRKTVQPNKQVKINSKLAVLDK